MNDFLRITGGYNEGYVNVPYKIVDERLYGRLRTSTDITISNINEMVLKKSQHNIFPITIIRHVSLLTRSTNIYIKINLVRNREMDPRVKEVIEGAMNTCNNDLRSLEPLIDGKMGSVLDYCFTKNTTNADRFADCILEKNKRVQEIMKSIEFKVLFFSKAANNCLVKKSVQECTEETVRGLREVIDNTKRSIEKL